MIRFKRKAIEEGTRFTVIDQGSSCKGTLKEGINVLIKGVFEGELSSVESLTIISPGEVEALITTKALFIDSKVRGTLRADKVHLGTHAHFSGDIHTRILEIAEGAFFSGHCYMKGGVEAPELQMQVS